jgi:hypothetical protein
MNADTAFAIWRACFEGYAHWPNTLERGRPYSGGDAWGCVGRWVSGSWHTADSERYIVGLESYMSQRVWEQRDFIEL